LSAVARSAKADAVRNEGPASGALVYL
jgi:hypothetical protein